MVDRIAISGKTYSGKTTLADALKAEGYFEIKFSDSLKVMGIEALNLHSRWPHTLQDILNYKPEYRQFLQEYGKLIGFDTRPAFVARALVPWQDAGRPPCFFDCVRTTEQWDILKQWDFTLVSIEVPQRVQFDRAIQAGTTETEFRTVIQNHPKEQGIRHLLTDDDECVILKGSDDVVYNVQLLKAL